MMTSQQLETGAEVVASSRVPTLVALAGACMALCCALIGTANAQLAELDRIVAVVEEDVVLASELVERINVIKEQFKARQSTPPPNDVLVNQLLERLIIESVQMQMARRAGMRINDQELNQAIVNIAAQNNMPLAQFRQAITADGMSYPEFRDQVRREMTIVRVQQARVASRVTISPREVDAMLTSELGQQITSDDYRVGHILLAVEGESPAAWDAAEAKAASLFAELQSGADFCDVSAANSASARSLECGDLGWRKAPALPSLFADKVSKLKEGDLLPPIKSGGGMHLVKLLGRRGATEELAESKVRHILVRRSAIMDDNQAEEKIRKVRARVVAGEDFCELAEENSDDPGSALVCGDLGWSSPDAYKAEFADTIRKSEPGVLSEAFATDFGWHILEVMERRSRDRSDENRRTLARRYLYNQRYEEELENWLAEIREDAYVEAKL